MIYINDVPFDWNKKPENWAEKLIHKSYNDLNKKFNLDNNGTIVMNFRKNIGVNVKRYKNLKQEKGTTVRKFPHSVGVSRTSIVTNEDGETFVIVLADKKVISNGEQKYFPRENIRFTGALTFMKKDKELLVYLYAFNTILLDSPDERYYLNSNQRSMFKLLDQTKDISDERAKIKEKAQLIDIVEGMSEEQLTVFGRRLGITINSNQDRSIAEANILNKLDQVPEYKKDIRKFVEMYNKDFFEAIDVVKSAIEKGVLTMQEKKSRNTVNAEFYIDGDEKPFFKTLVKSKREMEDDVAVYLSKDPTTLAIIQNKL